MQSIPVEQILQNELNKLDAWKKLIEKTENEWRKKGVIRDEYKVDHDTLMKQIKDCNKVVESCICNFADRRGNLMHLTIDLHFDTSPTAAVETTAKALNLIDQWFKENKINYKGDYTNIKIEVTPDDRPRIKLWFLRGQKVKTLCCMTDIPVWQAIEHNGFFCQDHAERIENLELKEHIEKIRRHIKPGKKVQQLAKIMNEPDDSKAKIQKFVNSIHKW